MHFSFPQELSQQINLGSLQARNTTRSSEDSLEGEARGLFCGSEHGERADDKSNEKGGKDTPLMEWCLPGRSTHSLTAGAGEHKHA